MSTTAASFLHQSSQGGSASPCAVADCYAPVVLVLASHCHLHSVSLGVIDSRLTSLSYCALCWKVNQALEQMTGEREKWQSELLMLQVSSAGRLHAFRNVFAWHVGAGESCYMHTLVPEKISLMSGLCSSSPFLPFLQKSLHCRLS